MKRTNGHYALLFVLLGGLVGCASVPREAGFPDVRQNVTDRIGYQVQWYRGAPEEAEVAEAIRSQLRDALTVDEAVQIALLNNRWLQAIYEDLGVAQADVVQAGLLHNPIFGGDATFPTSGGIPDLFFSVVTNFLDIFYIPLRKAVANAAFEGAKLQVTGAAMDLSGQTRAAFYRVQADGQLLEMLQQVVLATEATYEAARRMHEAGNIRNLDLHNEQALYEQARLDLEAAEALMVEGRERLNSLMGLWGADTKWTLANRLPDIPEQQMDLSDLEKRAITTSLDLGIAKQEIETFGQLLGLTQSTALVPALDLGASAEREDGGWKIGPAAALALPIFDQGQARIATVQAELRRRQAKYLAVAVEVRSVVRVIRQRLITARRIAEHYQNVTLPLRSLITEESQLHYNAMQIGIFQLLLAKRQEIQAGRNYIQALHAYWVARSDLDLLLQGRHSNLSKFSQVETQMPVPLMVSTRGE
ncbi:MAG: TolC family protein [Rhodothermia bacterium]|nr:MAG: TolC family protein [Rhodothermia bacterium]